MEERVHWLNGSGCNRQKQDTKYACMGWTKWAQKETLRRENWKIGSWRVLRVLTRVEKIMAYDWGWPEMVDNSCLEDLEGRMRLKRMWKSIAQAGKKGGTNEWRWEVFLDLGSFIRNLMVDGWWVMLDHVSPAETWGVQSMKRAEGARPERRR